MNIHRIDVNPADKRIEQGPIVRASLKGGCDLLGCNCSTDPFLFISDGEVAFSITLTKAEAARIAAGHPVDIRNEVQV